MRLKKNENDLVYGLQKDYLEMSEYLNAPLFAGRVQTANTCSRNFHKGPHPRGVPSTPRSFALLVPEKTLACCLATRKRPEPHPP